MVLFIKKHPFISKMLSAWDSLLNMQSMSGVMEIKIVRMDDHRGYDGYREDNLSPLYFCNKVKVSSKN